jgi:hypothetical protein
MVDNCNCCQSAAGKHNEVIANLLKKVSLSEVSDLGPARGGDGDRAAKH